MSHTTDWFPGRVTNDYRENYQKIFGDGNARLNIRESKQKLSRENRDNSDRIPEKRH